MGDYRGLLRLDLFMEYAVVRFNREQKELSYKVYIADGLWCISQGLAPKSRWYDLIKPREKIDAQKTIDNILERAGIRVVWTY